MLTESEKAALCICASRNQHETAPSSACPLHVGGDAIERILEARATPTPAPVDALLDTALIARIWRDHAACTWVVHDTTVGPVWSCGIVHQPTTRDRHVAELVMTQVVADRHIVATDAATRAVAAYRKRWQRVAGRLRSALQGGQS